MASTLVLVVPNTQNQVSNTLDRIDALQSATVFN